MTEGVRASPQSPGLQPGVGGSWERDAREAIMPRKRVARGSWLRTADGCCVRSFRSIRPRSGSPLPLTTGVPFLCLTHLLQFPPSPSSVPYPVGPLSANRGGGLAVMALNNWRPFEFKI